MEWRTLAAQIRVAESPWSCAATGRFFVLAEELGRRVLASHRDAFGEDAIVDFVRDFLSRKFLELIQQENPRSAFVVWVTRAMISFRRRGDARVVEEPLGFGADSDSGIGNTPAASAEFVLDARAMLSRLSDRDRQIVQAVAVGEDREEIAARFKTSRANVDQIVSRIRTQWHKQQGGAA